MLQKTLRHLVKNVLDPRGTPVHGVKRLPLAPRLNRLDNKTVYLVDGGFGGSYEFLEEMQRWFLKNMPAVKTVVRRKAGNMFMDDPELWNEIKEKGNAMVMGVGGWDGCTSAVARHCQKLESEYGIPTAPMTTARFADYVQRDLETHGMPLRFSFPPYPVVGMPVSVLHQYVYGKDPITGVPLMEEVIEALTGPETEDDKKPKNQRISRARLIEANTEDDLRRLFLESGWTDGLPIVLPTADRVEEMLKGTSHDPDEVIGEMSISDSKMGLEYTVEKVAVNAVMAGARSEHLPVILAIASTEEPAFPSSTTSFGRMVAINGPIRHEISMNSGVGALSPFNEANAVIGRAWTLMSINLGNARVGETFLGSQGNNLNYNNMCVAENEERSVWKPFHVEKGFKPDESIVSLFRGWSVINSMGAVNHRPPHEETVILLKAFCALRSGATLILDPLVAKNLKEILGFDTKQDYCNWLSKNVQIPAGHYWGADLNYAFMLPLAEEGIEPYATWHKLPDDALIEPYNMPENISIIVVGGETNAFWKTTDFSYTTSASIDDWR